jgi:hypothetical protein
MYYLVIDESPRIKLLPFSEQYMLFDTMEKAMAKAVERGYANPFGPIDYPGSPGVMCSYWCGEVKINVLGIEMTGA